MNLPEWLNPHFTLGDVNPVQVGLRLGLAWIAGWIVALLANFRRIREPGDTLTPTLVLMSILIAMATQIIGDNVARAFSLVGALSIVRFRTVIPTSRDVAFVLASVVVGMAIGAGQFPVAGLGLIVVGAASLLQPRERLVSASSTGKLTLQISLSAGDAVTELLNRLCTGYQFKSLTTARRGAALEYVYIVQLRPEQSPRTILAELQRLEQVESVGWESAG